MVMSSMSVDRTTHHPGPCILPPHETDHGRETLELQLPTMGTMGSMEYSTGIDDRSIEVFLLATGHWSSGRD